MNFKRRISGVILAFVCAGCLFCCCITFVLYFKPFYYWEIGQLGIVELSGMDREEIAKNYDALIRYNLLWNRDELTLPDFPVSESGRIHFQEVKAVFDIVQCSAAAGLIVSVVWGIYKIRKREVQFLYGAALLGIFAPVLLGLWMLFDWDSLFYTFHDVVFQNSYWLFDPSTDPVITILPDSFFLHAAILILCGLLIGSVSFLATGCFLHRRFKKQQNK